MDIDDETLRLLGGWYAAVDPAKPVDLASPGGLAQYVPLDRWIDPDGGPIHSLRGDKDVVLGIVDTVRLASVRPQPNSTQLLAGFRGTGKSTELSRIAEELRRHQIFVVLHFSASEYLGLNAAPSPEELALCISAGLAERAAEVLGIKAFKQRGIWKRVGEFLQQDVEGDVGFNLVGLDLKANLRESKDFRDHLAKRLRHRPTAIRDFLHDVTEKVAKAVSPKQLVLLVDGLDKFSTPLEEVVGVYRGMADLFFQQSELLRLPGCHVVYVIPPYLGFLHKGLAESYSGRLRVLPSVKVRHRPSEGGRAHSPGIKALEELLQKRVDLDRLLGETRVSAIEHLVLASGGHIRDLFNLVRELLNHAMQTGLPIPPEAIEAAIRNVSQDRGVLFRGTVELLNHVRRSESLATLDEGLLGALAAAMDQYLVLSYRNGEVWYGVHPLIASGLDEALRALEREGREN